MNLSHLDRLRRARDLVAVKGYGVTATRLTCNSGQASILSWSMGPSQTRLGNWSGSPGSIADGRLRYALTLGSPRG